MSLVSSNINFPTWFLVGSGGTSRGVRTSDHYEGVANTHWNKLSFPLGSGKVALEGGRIIPTIIVGGLLEIHICGF